MMRRWMRTAALLLMPVIAACEEDPVVSDPADAVATMRLTLGSQVVAVHENGADKPIVILTGPSPITASFFRANGTEMSLPSASYRLDITSDNTGRVSFTRGTGSFSGTLNGNIAGSTVLRVSLLRTSDNRVVFGPHPVNITIQQSTES